MSRYSRFKHKIIRIIYPDSPSASSIPFWEYAKWFRWTNWTPKYPRVIDIQTKSGCNANCVFCNVGREQDQLHGTMRDEVWENIIDEIMTHPEVMRIHPYLLNDPLVDAKLPDKLEYLAKKKKKHKNPRVHLITNAGLLSEEFGYKLLHAEGIDEFNISFISIDPHIYEAMMIPLKFDKVMGNVLRFKKQWDRYAGKKPKLNVWTIRTDHVVGNLLNEKAYWRKIGLRFKARKLDNRAYPEIEQEGLVTREFSKVRICPIPFWRAWIMWNGDMIMCCVDQERSNLLGNCTGQSISKVWNGAEYRELRERWKNKDLAGLLCTKCKGT